MNQLKEMFKISHRIIKNKKLRIDPLDENNLPSDIAEEIISFLPLKDQVNACLVSKHWNATIGNTSTFKKNTMLSIQSENVRNIHQIIKRSHRFYENVTIRSDLYDQQWLQVNEEYDEVFIKNVTISGPSTYPSQFFNLLKLFRFSTNLRLLNTSITTMGHMMESNRLSMTNLDTLTISGIDEKVFELLTQSHPNLKTLILRFGSSIIWEFLKLNESIEALEMNFQFVMENFKIRDFNSRFLPSNLKLKNLIMGIDDFCDDKDYNMNDWLCGADQLSGVRRSDQTEKLHENMETFLKHQGNSLKMLKIILHQDLNNRVNRRTHFSRRSSPSQSLAALNFIIKSWPSLTVLESFTMRFMKYFQEDADKITMMKNLQKNLSIVFLGFQFINVNIPEQIAISFLGACPNVKELYVTILNEPILKYCANNLKNLNAIKCYQLDGDILGIYATMKKSKRCANLKIQIENGHVLG